MSNPERICCDQGAYVSLDHRTKDDTEDLEDLIVAAYRDAKAQADALAAQKLGPLAGGLGGDPGAGGMPGGPGLPAGF